MVWPIIVWPIMDDVRDSGRLILRTRSRLVNGFAVLARGVKRRDRGACSNHGDKKSGAANNCSRLLGEGSLGKNFYCPGRPGELRSARTRFPTTQRRLNFVYRTFVYSTARAQHRSGRLLGGHCGQARAVPLGRCDDLHFLPIIGKLSAAIEAGDIGSSESRSLRAARSAYSARKTVIRVPAAEKRIDQFVNHSTPSTARGS